MTTAEALMSGTKATIPATNMRIGVQEVGLARNAKIAPASESRDTKDHVQVDRKINPVMSGDLSREQQGREQPDGRDGGGSLHVRTSVEDRWGIETEGQKAVFDRTAGDLIGPKGPTPGGLGIWSDTVASAEFAGSSSSLGC